MRSIRRRAEPGITGQETEGALLVYKARNGAMEGVYSMSVCNARDREELCWVQIRKEDEREAG